jgi:hypothetical protein
MRRPAKILLLAVIVALLPLRSIAALIADSCGLEHEQMAAAQSIVEMQYSEAGSGKADTHCPGAVFLLAAAPAPLPARTDERGIALVQRRAPAFFPDKLDRPPLALHR